MTPSRISGDAHSVHHHPIQLLFCLSRLYGCSGAVHYSCIIHCSQLFCPASTACFQPHNLPVPISTTNRLSYPTFHWQPDTHLPNSPSQTPKIHLGSHLALCDNEHTDDSSFRDRNSLSVAFLFPKIIHTFYYYFVCSLGLLVSPLLGTQLCH